MKRSIIITNILLITMLAPISAQILNVSKITQKQDNWCWAGVSECILEFYGKSIPQCDIAEYTRTHEQFPDVNFGSSACCLSPSTCNNWNYLVGGSGSIEDILVHFSNLGNYTVTATIPLTDITSDLAANRPFIIRWAWTAGGGHFLVGHGVTGENLYYMNPWPGEGKKMAKYSWVVSGADHSWTHTLRLYPSARIPADAGAISGNSTVCQGQTSVTYKVPFILRALKYNWTLPDGATGESTADSITVDFGKQAVSGEISVKGQNNLGDGKTATFQVNVNPLPAAAGTITGLPMVCQRQRSITYSVPEIAHATSYEWTVNIDATTKINKNSITLDFGVRIGEGTISVRGKNDCGSGDESVLNIKLSGIPDTPVITQKGNDLASSSPIGNQWFDSDGPIEGAVSQTYTIAKSDDYYVMVTIDGCVSDPSETLSVTLNGIDESRQGKVLLFPNPVTDQLHVDTGGISTPVVISILNSLGQTLHKSTLTADAIIEVGNFSPGIYLVRIETPNAVSTQKLIRK